MVKTSSSVESYLWDMVSVVSSMQEEHNKLTHKEQQFLVNCLTALYSGVDINDFKSLYRWQTEKGFSKDVTDVSVYKNKLGTKRWAVTGRDVFTFNKFFLWHIEALKNGGSEFSFVLKVKS